MFGKFRLEIDLGNAGMRNERHLAEAVAGVATKLEWGETTGLIRDVNGNTVGRYELKEDPDGEEG
jgi:hypothetical protein